MVKPNCALEDTVDSHQEAGKTPSARKRERVVKRRRRWARTQHEYAPSKPVRESRRSRLRRQLSLRGNEWFDEELSERRVSYESAVPELPAVAVSREPDASINSDLAGNDARCSTCPSRPSP